MNPLEQLVDDCEASGVKRRVVLLRSASARENDAADAISRHVRTRRHLLAPGLLAVWWHGANPAWPGALPGDVQARLFDLPDDADALLDALPITPPPAIRRGAPLDDDSLLAMERGLLRADVSRFVRRAPVLRLTESGPHMAWEKRFLHLPELTDTLAPGRDALADRTRLRLLCRTLDARMLRHLSDMHELAATGPFALNLNVSSLPGPEFARFDAVLPARLRGRVVLVLSPGDVLADPAAFAAARDAVRAAGFKVMLRGMSAALLPAVSLGRMQLDYVGLRWSRELARLPLPGNGVLAGAQVVLGGVDGAAALRWAARAGVHLFAGTGPGIGPGFRSVMRLDAGARVP